MSDGDPENAASLNVGSQKLTDIGEAALEQIQGLVASTWIKQTSGTAQNLFGVCGANPLSGGSLPAFIAVGAAAAAPPTILTSPDGFTWTARTAVGTSTAAFGVLANSSGGLAVVIANGASGQNLMTSPDGSTWTLRTSNITLANQLGGIAFSGTLWCVVGGAGGAPAVATSSDGLTWTARTLGGASDQMVSVTWAPSLSLFIACGYNTGTNAAEVFTSPDGITWTSRTVPTAGTSKSVSLVWSSATSTAMVVSSASVWTSTDGITWTLQSASTSGAYTIGGGPYLVHTGRQWITPSNNAGCLVATALSPGVANWTRRGENAPAVQVNSIATGFLGKLIMVGNGGLILTGLTTQLV